MKNFTKMMVALALCVLGVTSANAQEGEKVYATFENPTGITWDAENMTFSWNSQWGNQLHNIGLPNGDLSEYEKLVIDCEILEGDGYRFMFYANQKGTTAGGVTIVTESGAHEYMLSDFSMDKDYLTDCSEICLSGYNASGKVKVNEVYLVKATDALASYKTELSKLITKANAISPVGKTVESFNALEDAIAAAQTALDAVDATQESLTAATAALQNVIDALQLAEGYTDMTKEMFKTWASHQATEGTVNASCSYVIGSASDLPYGLSSVDMNNYADLSEYNYLVVAYYAGEPRFCFNRLTAQGQDNADEALSEMIDIPGNARSTETYEAKSEDGTYLVIDLKKMVEKQGFAHLHCIKGKSYGATVIITDMLLYTGETNPVTTGIVTVDSQKPAVKGMFDLQGRRVAEPTKGLYIVNGKKVVIK